MAEAYSLRSPSAPGTLPPSENRFFTPPKEDSMRMETKDGTCPSCGGALEIIDADDVTMTVRCLDCQDEYQVETDGLNDAGVHYWPNFMADKLMEGDDE